MEELLKLFEPYLTKRDLKKALRISKRHYLFIGHKTITVPVKKLHRKIKTWNASDRNNTEYDNVTDYIGYYLFGFIPIYLKQIDRYIRCEDGYEIREDIITEHKDKIL